MKRIFTYVFFLSIISLDVFAQEVIKNESDNSKVFVGVDYFTGESTLSTENSEVAPRSYDTDLDQTGIRFKLGVQGDNNIRYQGFIKIEELDEVFDETLYGFGADALFTYSKASKLNPFFLVGFSSGFTELSDESVEYTEEMLNALALKIGVGALVKLDKRIELQVGYDYQYRMWEEIKYKEKDDELYNNEIDMKDTSQSFYAGINFFF